jgi:putative flippase GtrA
MRTFVAVGAAGFVLQITLLGSLTMGLNWPYTLATVLAVEAAVLHNFCWHERWTWRDRTGGAPGLPARLLRFHLTTGATSLAGNLAFTALCVVWIGINVLAANVLAVLIMSLANYLVADRWVFGRRVAVTLTTVSLLVPSSQAHAAELKPATRAAWDRHVAAIESSSKPDDRAAPLAEPQGRAVHVAGGTVYEWRGSTVIRGITVDRLVAALIDSGTPPPQEDVLEARVLQRKGQTLRVYLKLVRTAIITVTYDTEHDVTFERPSHCLATSRSVATKIAETGGGDRGFLWRLNSYWRYRQVGDAVAVDVLSVSLSRDVPTLARPIAAPIVGHIARESMTRTLESVRLFGEKLGGG